MTATRSPRLLVARSLDRAAGLIDLLRDSGIETTAAPAIERAPVRDAAGRARLAQARRDLLGGAYAWVAVTSVNAVDALLGAPGSHAVAAGTRWACVGPATRRAVESHGLTVEVTPASRMTGAGLVEAFPAPTSGSRRVLLPLGDLAAPTLPDGLRAQGWDPDVVVAYRTVARDLPDHVVERARGDGYDAVVIASGSAARQVAARLGPQRVVAIGEPSAVASRQAGHEVLAVATRPTDDALARAVVGALRVGAGRADLPPAEPADTPPADTLAPDTPADAPLTDATPTNALPADAPRPATSTPDRPSMEEPA